MTADECSDTYRSSPVWVTLCKQAHSMACRDQSYAIPCSGYGWCALFTSRFRAGALRKSDRAGRRRQPKVNTVLASLIFRNIVLKDSTQFSNNYFNSYPLSGCQIAGHTLAEFRVSN